ncbi:MAG: PEP-CTERM sorting domain-containing protein [Pseudomonadota bacterium]
MFSTTFGAPTNNGPFAGAAITVGQITLAPTVTAADWTIGSYQFAIETVQVFARDLGLDFLLTGSLNNGAQLVGPLEIFMETNIAGVFQFARVPEPTTLAMMLVGICGLVAMRRRQYQRAA